MTSEVIDVEATEVAPERALAIQETVALPVSVDVALQQWHDYQRLTRELLDDTDYQKIGQKQFKKKSAWRKYARAFNITDRVTFEDINRADDGFPLWARIRVEARATNGRTAEADHECHISERCCPMARGEECMKRTWRGHDCCADGCTGRLHWSHPGDLPATALTRAKNRAISDLIGAGEVSAEEMTERHVEQGSTGPISPAEYQQQRKERVGKTPQQTAKAAVQGRTPDQQSEVAEMLKVKRPQCPEHGPLTPFGSGIATGTKKPYGAFWKCKRDCKEDNGRPTAVYHDKYLAGLQANENTSDEKPDYDALPFEE